MRSFIFHILKRSEWADAETHGIYWPSRANQEGFIHFSFADQLTGVAHSFFLGCTDLIVLKVPLARVAAAIRIEPDVDGFPHLYRELRVEEVTAVIPWNPTAQGRFLLPDELKSLE